MIGPRRLFCGVAVLALLALVPGCPPAGGQTPESDSLSKPVYVTHVYDGDTIRVKSGDGAVRRVRLIGVDTPERDDRRENERYWAQMATRFVVHRLLDKLVRLSYDWEREDRYSRTLAYVWTEDGELFNRSLIREGFSPAFLVYRYRPDYQKLFRQEEKDARRQGRGMWGKQAPPAVDVGQAGGRLGEYLSVRFRCGRVAGGRNYVFLWTSDMKFQVLISKGVAWPEPAESLFLGKELVVTGVLEGPRELFRVYVFFPHQISHQTR